MKLVISEKPSAAKSIAKYLHANQRNDGYFQNDQYYVTWARGHCVTLANPDAYGFGKWNIEDLPIIPDLFKLIGIESTKKELKTIRGLINKSEVTEVINATDAEREGELIFRLIYEYLNCNKPVKRLWVQNNTEVAIGKAFDNLKPGSEYDGYYLSAKSRSLADWLIGINSTRAFTLVSDTGGVLSLGRVQTPVLALICERFLINRDFKQVVKFNIKADFEKDTISFSAICETGKEKKQEVETIISGELEDFLVSKVEQKDENKSPPVLFDIGLAQQFANKHLNFTASQTLEHIQSLYEKKLVTYPRTDSNYLNSDMKDMVRQVQGDLSSLEFLPQESIEKILKDPLYEKPFNDEKVSDHHAIIPTGVIANYTNLNQSEIAIYEMIVTRFYAAFSSQRIRSMSTVVIRSGEYDFIAKGSITKDGGWALIEAKGLPREIKLPGLQEGEKLFSQKAEPLQVISKPPPLFNDGTMILAMETAGKKVEDIEMRDAMKSRGLGTAATRDSFVELLLKRKYIDRKGKSLIPTELGLKVYDKVKNLPLASAEMTGEWEFKLNKILKREFDEGQFLHEIKEFTATITKDLGAAGISVDSIKCPKCKKGNIKEGSKGYYCSRFKAEDGPCELTIWKVVAKKKLPPTAIQSLLTKGISATIKGFKSKEDKPFDAKLKLNTETGKVGFFFENKEGQKGKK